MPSCPSGSLKKSGGWNYRVLMHIHGEEAFFQIHEVYYDVLGSVVAFSEKAIAPGGNTLDELESDMTLMRDALKKDILDKLDLEKRFRSNGRPRKKM